MTDLKFSVDEAVVITGGALTHRSATALTIEASSGMGEVHVLADIHTAHMTESSYISVGTPQPTTNDHAKTGVSTTHDADEHSIRNSATELPGWMEFCASSAWIQTDSKGSGTITLQDVTDVKSGRHYSFVVMNCHH